jgi:neutral ceramidase
MNHSPSAPASAPVLLAGGATVDLTPSGSVFLFGYPHVRRYSTGVHDPLECDAFYLKSGAGEALFLANDLIVVSKAMTREVRRRIAAGTGVPENAIMISATHTHSAPIVADYLSNALDPVVPKADPGLVAKLVDGMVAAGEAAVRSAVPAEIGLGVAKAQGVGSNRHDPGGPTDAETPVLIARSAAEGQAIACMIVYGMHPTVLHEDSTLISGDFPHFTRQFLRAGMLPRGCPVLFHQGASGDQSPRHVTQANTFAEARRLGENLGKSIAAVLPSLAYRRDAEVLARGCELELEPRQFPAVPEAERALAAARARYAALKSGGASRQDVRTAECDVFGAEETVTLSRAAIDGRLAAAVKTCAPAEIQVLQVGPWRFVAWPGEVFVEYALDLKRRSPDTFLITLANGDLQGYLVTPEAARKGGYEANNAVFSPMNGARLIAATLELLNGGRNGCA